LIEKKHRIPQMAAAALLLGGPACGDSNGGGTPGGSTSGVSVSSSRVEEIAKATCSQYKKCETSDFNDEFDSLADCTATYVDALDTSGDLSSEQKKCLDAFLDLYACVSTLSCTDLADEDPDGKCDGPVQRYAELCPDDSSYGYDYGTPPGNGKRARRMRIPKP
jgi:hypothetical protein